MAALPQLTVGKLSLGGKVGVTALMGALVFAVYWVGFYTEISAKRSSAEADKTRLATELSSQTANKLSFTKDKDELNDRMVHQKDLNKAFPVETKAAGFLSALQQVANVSGVDLKAWQPEEEKTESFYAKFPMKLEMSGRFHQIAKFAYEAGKVERIINVEDLELSDPKPEGDEVVLKAKCVATTFHSVPPKTAAAGSGAPGRPPVPPAGGAK